MKLSENTIQVLKNFAQINSNLVIEPGKTLKTIAPSKTLYAIAQIEDDFPTKFGIYDLNEFLSVINLFDQPELAFFDNHLTISSNSGRSKLKYYYTDPDMLTYPTREVKMPPAEINLDWSNDSLAKIKQAAGALGHEEVSLTPSNGNLTLTVFEDKNNTSNTFALDIPGSHAGNEFKLIFNIGTLKKILPLDYKVSISSRLVSHFESADSSMKIEYYIPLEKTSKYGA